MNHQEFNLHKLTQNLIEIETSKASLLKQIREATEANINQLTGNYTEIQEYTGKSIGLGLDFLMDIIEKETFGKVSRISIVNYDVNDTTKPLIIKVYSDKWVTCPVPLILIFNGELNSLKIVTSIQMFCGHNGNFYINFED